MSCRYYIAGEKIAKYNSSGQQQWKINNDIGPNIALHSLGGILVMGSAIFSNTPKSIISHYDGNGNLLWTSVEGFPPGGKAVSNASGIKVYSEKTTNPQKDFTKNINLSKEAKGTYYIELITDGKKSVEKIILN